MSTSPEMAVESDVTTEIELAPVEIGHGHGHGHGHVSELPPGSIVVRARRHAILLADVEASLEQRPR